MRVRKTPPAGRRHGLASPHRRAEHETSAALASALQLRCRGRRDHRPAGCDRRDKSVTHTARERGDRGRVGRRSSPVSEGVVSVQLRGRRTSPDGEGVTSVPRWMRRSPPKGGCCNIVQTRQVGALDTRGHRRGLRTNKVEGSARRPEARAIDPVPTGDKEEEAHVTRE